MVCSAGGPKAIAVLLACHNRKPITLACLESVFAQKLDSRIRVECILVDDGSTDGTAKAVSEAFPEVVLMTGAGDLFWSGGMRVAFSAALDRVPGFDHFLWLNDDVILEEDAIGRLLEASDVLRRSQERPAIVVGTVVDPRNRMPTYGGLLLRWPLPILRLADPGSAPRRCSTMNGNCVLIDREVAREVGNVSPEFTHLRGDIEYGFRARANGIEVWLAPGTYGSCPPNPIGRWRSADLTIIERFASLREPKYAVSEKWILARRHLGPFGIISVAFPYLYVLLNHPVEKVRRLAKGVRQQLRKAMR